MTVKDVDELEDGDADDEQGLDHDEDEDDKVKEVKCSLWLY